ncbi:MAG: methylmalonyl Co-A mutase-associated GTPase MeaB [Rhodospirillales bacterium]|jgi:LAO/AO transport system kinase|nr:methylmalonyl Co-A mutase-associated GTPase MeaB [Rhodospirillales bacterium]
MSAKAPTLSALTAGGKRALAAALARIEEAPEAEDTIALLDQAWAAGRAHVLGITGPPGVGKSTLTASLIRAWRAAGERVAVIAVDPSSKISGGALLGDRIRLAVEPDEGLFIRSMAARDRLGGLAPDTVAAAALMRAAFDRVLIETVGVGQSETDIALAADTVLLCIQPGSGDLVQFMKAGIVEVPDVIAVTKADMGAPAQRTLREARTMLGGVREAGGWRVPVLATSATAGTGIGELLADIDRHRDWLLSDTRLAARRADRERRWLEAALRDRFGSDGLQRIGAIAESASMSPFQRLRDFSAQLRKQRS